ASGIHRGRGEQATRVVHVNGQHAAAVRAVGQQAAGRPVLATGEAVAVHRAQGTVDPVGAEGAQVAVAVDVAAHVPGGVVAQALAAGQLAVGVVVLFPRLAPVGIVEADETVEVGVSGLLQQAGSPHVGGRRRGAGPCGHRLTEQVSRGRVVTVGGDAVVL